MTWINKRLKVGVNLSEILAQSQGVVDRGMDVARRHRVAEAEQLERAIRVCGDGLRSAVDQRLVVHFAAI